MFVWLMFALKIPIVALFTIVWWATRAPEPAAGEGAEDWKRPPVGPDHPRPRKPGPSRRGPHAEPAPRPPARVRALRGRTLRKPSHRNS
jgi:hypothetical protein